MNRSMGRERRHRTVFGAALMVSTLLAAGCGAGAAEDSGRAQTVKVGFLYDTHAANVWTLNECDDKNVKFDLVNFKQFAEVERAFQSRQIDVASMGYQNLAQMVGSGFTEFKAIAGVYTGAEHITVRSGADITSWQDLAGKRIGIPPNSFVEMLFRSGAEENGLNMKDVEIEPFPGAGPPMLAALKKGDIDAMVAWEPNSAKSVVQGIGEYPKNFDLQQGSIGKATGLLYATNELIQRNKPAVESLVRCLKERTDYLEADVDEWVKVLRTNTGLSQKVAETAIKTGDMDIKLYKDSAQKIIQTFAENGLLKDVSGEVPEYLDYSFLEKVTGNSKADLGGA